MPNGKPGDHPLTDILIHGRKVFSAEIEGLIRDLSQLLSRTELNGLVDWLNPPPESVFQAQLRSRLLQARETAKARGWDVDDPVPGALALEDILLQLEEAAKSRDEVEIWVPNRLKIGGKPFPHDMAMEVLRDRASELGLEPAGYTPGEGGRTYLFHK